MKILYIGVIVLLCVVNEIQSEWIRSGLCHGCQHEGYTRIKRAKYYSRPPLRYYNRPPMSYPNKATFTLTPPRGYPMDDDRQLHFRPKVSKRPNTEVLGDEDLKNIMDFLSTQDLDKVVKFDNENQKEPPRYSLQSFERPNYIPVGADKYNSKIIYNDNNPELDNHNLSFQDSYVSDDPNFRHDSIEYNIINDNEFTNDKPFTFPDLEPSGLFINKDNIVLNTPTDVVQNQQFDGFNAHAYQEANGNQNNGNIFTDSSIMQEEMLPKPSNLREEDYEVSYTNNVPAVVKADSDTYQIENFGELPLMNYHSKLDTVDSYRVPHYTVTSLKKYGAPASKVKVPVEPAPPPSAVQQQSDAHLKAIKIWTHKSRGAAYTLHDDGTLSLDKPVRQKSYYGHH